MGINQSNMSLFGSSESDDLWSHTVVDGCVHVNMFEGGEPRHLAIRHHPQLDLVHAGANLAHELVGGAPIDGGYGDVANQLMAEGSKAGRVEKRMHLRKVRQDKVQVNESGRW